MRPGQHTKRLITHLMTWLSLVALCANPVLAVQTKCACGESSSKEITATQNGSGCCQRKAAEKQAVQTSCCNKSTKSCCLTANTSDCCAKPATTNNHPCNCCSSNNQSNECQCTQCQCSSGDDSAPLAPALPVDINQNIAQYVAVSTLSLDVIPSLGISSSGWTILQSNRVASSALDTCALLSRFTC